MPLIHMKDEGFRMVIAEFSQCRDFYSDKGVSGKNDPRSSQIARCR